MWLHSLKVAQLLRSAACLHTNQSQSYLNRLVHLSTKVLKDFLISSGIMVKAQIKFSQTPTPAPLGINVYVVCLHSVKNVTSRTRNFMTNKCQKTLINANVDVKPH